MVSEKAQGENLNGHVDREELLNKLIAQDPDRVETVTRKFAFDEDFVREVLGALLSRGDLMKHHHRLVKPDYFIDEAHQLIFRLARDHYDKYAGLPTKAYLMNSIKEELKGKEPAVVLYHTAELQVVLEYFKDIDLPVPVDEKLREFEETQEAHVGVMKIVAALKKGMSSADLDTLISGIVERRQAIRNAHLEDTRLCTLDELFEETEDEYHWLVTDRIPAGKLGLVAGPAKKGKTTSVLHTAIDVIFDGEALGQKAEPFHILYLDFENDTSYLKNVILEPAMKGRDWKELGRWLHVSNRQVRSEHLKLQPYVTAEYVSRLVGQYEGRVLVLIDSLRRAFGRTPGLKSNWEWDASIINSLLDPLGEFCHTSGHSTWVIHHHNNDGRASGSTDLIAVPDVIWDFGVVGDSTERVVKIGGRMPYIEPLHLSFEDGKYKYLGAGKDGANAKRENKAVAIMTRIVSRLAAGPLSVAEMTHDGIAGRDALYAACRVLKEQSVVADDKKKLHLAADWMSQWKRYCSSLGVKDSTPGVVQVEA
jgi:hypothetical protein